MKRKVYMKQNKWLILLFLPLFVACFQDNTTLADKLLSHITIEQGIDSVYNIYKFDTLVIKPVISQENVDKPLSYTWEVNLEPYSHDEVFEYVGKELGKFNCRLIVENEDGKSFFPFLLYVNSDYEYGITVLSCDDGGNSMLSFMQEPMTADVDAQFTSYDCFSHNNPDTDFAAGAADVVQCGGRLIIACQGGGNRDDDPTIYYLNEKTMVIENMFTVPEYDDFEPTALGVPTISPEGSNYPILCKNGKVYDFSVVEGVVSKPRKLKYTYAQKCLTNVNQGTYYDILLFDNDNKGLSLIYYGNGPYYCSESYHLMLDDSLFSTKNHFADMELVTMTEIRMTQKQKSITGHQEFLAMTRIAGDGGRGTQTQVLYTDFWGYDYVNQKPVFFTENTQVENLMKNPVEITTPCIANKTNYTFFFADGNKVRVWNYVSDLAGLPNAKTLLTVGSPFAKITGFEMSEDHEKTYVSFYDPERPGLNGSVWVFETATGKVLERHNNFCYKPVKMFYKTR